MTQEDKYHVVEKSSRECIDRFVRFVKSTHAGGRNFAKSAPCTRAYITNHLTIH